MDAGERAQSEAGVADDRRWRPALDARSASGYSAIFIFPEPIHGLDGDRRRHLVFGGRQGLAQDLRSKQTQQEAEANAARRVDYAGVVSRLATWICGGLSEDRASDLRRGPHVE